MVQSRHKKILLAVFGVVLFLGVAFLVYQYIAAPHARDWKVYIDSARGFSVEYPADLVTPNDHGEPTTVPFELLNSATSLSAFSIWVYPTTAPDIQTWIQGRNEITDGGTPISGTTIIDGVEAIYIENSNGAYSFSFVNGGDVWTLGTNNDYLSQEDV